MNIIRSSGASEVSTMSNVLGALDAAVASGVITDTDTAMAYIKQLVTDQIVLDGLHDVPTADAIVNLLMRDVVGNKVDAAADGAVTSTESLVAYTKQLVGLVLSIPTTAMRGTDSAALASALGALNDAAAAGAVTDADTAMAYIKQLVTYTETGGSTLNIPQCAGAIAYADADAADDTANGLTTSTPKKTLTAASAVAGAGGVVISKAGTYTENFVMSYSAQEFWPEIGTILDGDGTCLTISGGYCRVRGYLEITPAADQTGVAVTTLGGNILDDIRVVGSESTYGFDIDTTKNILNRCKCSGIKETGKAYNINASRNVLNDCSTVGEADSYGYFVDGAALKGGKLVRCTSTGHGESGFYLGDVSGMSVIQCSSGAGDGLWVDLNNANVWDDDFNYDREVFKEIDFTDASTTFNLFKVTGIVKIEGLFGHVEEVLNAELGNCKLEVVAGAHTEDLTTTASLNDVAAGSFIGKTAAAGTALTVGSSAAPQVLENASYRDPAVISIVVAETGTNTYIRLLSDDNAGNKDGKIHWHCRWSPENETGFVEAV